MFDLFGDNTPTPSAGIELPAVPDSSREKIAWERELLGVCLSHNPLLAIIGKQDSGVTMCGHVNAEMSAQSVLMAGMVKGVVLKQTRDKRSFITAVLEDLTGTVEVTVWPETYQATKDLWQEGSMLLVEGKVKVREDVAGITCERATAYQGGEIQHETMGNGGKVQGARRNGKDKKKSLSIRIGQTEAAETDLARLYRVTDLLKEYPGKDKVRLAIEERGAVTQLELTQVTTDCCKELLTALGSLGVGVEVIEEAS